MRLVKIQATLGPSSSSPEILRKMAEAGMDGCRINMSHCSHGLARELVAKIRQLSKEISRPIAIGADLRGPKLRIGDVEGGSIMLEEGGIVQIAFDHRTYIPGAISVNYPHLARDVKPGDPVLLNDGFIRLRVESVRPDRVLCNVEKGGVLSSRKGFNLPGIPLQVPSLTVKDEADIGLAVELGLDFLFVSFARSSKHIQDVRTAISQKGADIPLVAKIERQEGVDALQEIIEAADGVCVARGDLGIETPLGEVPEIQREAVRLCRQAGKFVMIGCQHLASMIANPTPLRAEVADIAAVVRDGYDAIVLSDETAAGDYPVEAVAVASQVIVRTESHLRIADPRNGYTSAYTSASLGPAVVVSSDGNAVRRLSSTRCASPIVAATDRPDLANWLSTWWGAIPVLIADISNPHTAARQALAEAAKVDPSLAASKPLVLYEVSRP